MLKPWGSPVSCSRALVDVLRHALAVGEAHEPQLVARAVDLDHRAGDDALREPTGTSMSRSPSGLSGPCSSRAALVPASIAPRSSSSCQLRVRRVSPRPARPASAVHRTSSRRRSGDPPGALPQNMNVVYVRPHDTRTHRSRRLARPHRPRRLDGAGPDRPPVRHGPGQVRPLRRAAVRLARVRARRGAARRACAARRSGRRDRRGDRHGRRDRRIRRAPPRQPVDPGDDPGPRRRASDSPRSASSSRVGAATAGE